MGRKLFTYHDVDRCVSEEEFDALKNKLIPDIWHDLDTSNHKFLRVISGVYDIEIRFFNGNWVYRGKRCFGRSLEEERWKPNSCPHQYRIHRKTYYLAEEGVGNWKRKFLTSGFDSHKQYHRLILPNGQEIEFDSDTGHFSTKVPGKEWRVRNNCYEFHYSSDEEFEKLYQNKSSL